MKQFAFPTINLCRELGEWRKGEGGLGGGVLPNYFRLPLVLTQAHGLRLS